MLFIPLLSDCQFVPFHWAMRLALTPPAVVKWPPAIRLPFYTVSASTLSFIPPPSACQVVPFQAAMFDAVVSPATVKVPPTTNRGGEGLAPSGSHVVVAQ